MSVLLLLVGAYSALRGVGALRRASRTRQRRRRSRADLAPAADLLLGAVLIAGAMDRLPRIRGFSVVLGALFVLVMTAAALQARSAVGRVRRMREGEAARFRARFGGMAGGPELD